MHVKVTFDVTIAEIEQHMRPVLNCAIEFQSLSIFILIVVYVVYAQGSLAYCVIIKFIYLSPYFCCRLMPGVSITR